MLLASSDRMVRPAFFRALILASLFLTLSTSASAVESICRGGSSPDSNVVWCDDFNDGSWLSSPSWSASSGRDSEGSEAVKCGGFGFQDDCAAYTGARMYFDGNYGYDNHYGENVLPSGYNEVYIRLYIQFSNPFDWGNVSDKGIYLFNSSRSWNMKLEYNQWGNGMPGFASYATPGERRGQNQGKDIRWQPGKWYLVELYVKLNDPGVPNGVVKVWIDDASVPVTSQTLRLSYSDLTIRDGGQDGSFNEIGLHEYHNGCQSGSSCPPSIAQWIKWDNMIISRSRIGPMGQPSGGPAPILTKRPNPPSGISVR